MIIRNHFHRQPLLPKGRLIRGQSVAGLDGLGELGDELAAMQAVPDVVTKLKSLIIAHAGPITLGSVQNNNSLPAIIYTCARCYNTAGSGGMGEEAQRYWNAWRAQAEPQESNDNIYWVLARCVARWSDQLIQAANDQINSGILLDAAASRCVYTLMDTTQQGTTWYGGTVTTSKLSNSQWGATLEVAFNSIAKGIVGGALSFTYLDVLIKAFGAAPNQRRFPVWTPPYTGVTAQDPRAVAFRAAVRQTGWNNAVQLWFGYTQQAWAAQDAAWEEQDRQLSGAIVALNYVSGKALYDQIADKVNDYFAARGEAIAAIGQFQQLQSGPLASNIPAADIAAMDAIKKQFSSVDVQVNTTLAPLGLWPSATSVGLSFLGVAQLLLGGVIAVAALGLIVWAIALMTETSRTAAAQTKATATNILATVDQLKASAQRVYDASAKTPADEKVYQDSLLATEALYKSIPLPPSGSDPLGLKWIALLGVVGIGGFVAWKMLGKKA